MKLTALETVFCDEENAVRTLLAINKSHPEDTCLRTVIHTDALPQELLDAVLEAGTYAPTGRGQQSPVIIAVSAAEYRKKIAELNAAVMGKDGDPYYGAPTVILVLTDKDSATGVEDASCVLENMMLAAASLGLGTVWVHRERDIFESEDG